MLSELRVTDPPSANDREYANRNEDIDLSEIKPTLIGSIYEKMVYYLDAKPNTCKYLWKSLNQDIKYISKFNEVMNNDQLFTAIVYLIKYRSENGMNCDNFITEINTLFPDIWNDMTKEIRICIMLDTTSSMGHTIIAQKNEAHELYQKLQTAFGAVVSIKSIAIGYLDTIHTKIYFSDVSPFFLHLFCAVFPPVSAPNRVV